MKKFPKLKKFQLVEIFWRDAVDDSTGWEIEASYNYEDHVASSFHLSSGYFMKATGATFFFCQSYRPADEQVRGRMSIPLAAIVRITRLKK